MERQVYGTRYYGIWSGIHFTSLSAMFWAGFNDIENEGNFTNYLNSVVLRKEDGFWPWYPGEPNGGVLENCAAVWPSRDSWFDYMCFEKAQGFCYIQPRPRLIMRGVYHVDVSWVTE